LSFAAYSAQHDARCAAESCQYFEPFCHACACCSPPIAYAASPAERLPHYLFDVAVADERAKRHAITPITPRRHVTYIHHPTVFACR
jgi:hypothetical protein